MKIIPLLSGLVFLLCCKQGPLPSKLNTTKHLQDTPAIVAPLNLIIPSGNTIITRFAPPSTHERITTKDTTSFAYYLQHQFR